MSDLDDFMVHAVVLRPFSGMGSHGAVLAAARTRRCFVDGKRRLVRDRDGAQVISETTLYDTDLGAEALYKPRGQVTLPSGQVATVIACHRRDGGALDLPDHLEVNLT